MPRPRDPNAPPRRRRRRASLDTPETQAGATVVHGEVTRPGRAITRQELRAAMETAANLNIDISADGRTGTATVTVGSNSEHARLSPSASNRWLNCPSSIVLHEQLRAQPGYVEPPDGEAAIYGRRLHAAAEAFLRGDPDAAEGMNAADLRLVQPYIDHVGSLMQLMPGAVLIVEERLHTLVEDCWGTCDCSIWHAPTNELWVIDLKTGHGRVDATENTQLGIYALGVEEYIHANNALNARARGIIGTDRTVTRYHLQIVQPRDEDEPIKSWTTTHDWLSALRGRIYSASNDLLDIANGIADPAPRLGSHCEYCPAAPNCPAMRDRAMSVFDSQSLGLPPNRSLVEAVDIAPSVGYALQTAARITPEQIAFFLSNSDRITAFLDACRDRALSEQIPGFKVVEARTRRRWGSEETVINDLIAAGREDLLRRLPPTIGEAERALGRGHVIIRENAIAPAGVPTVAPVSDPRPALDRNRVFRVEGSDGVASPE